MKIQFEQCHHNNEYPIFLSDKFLSSESNEYGWICGYEGSERVVILPYIIYKKSIFRIMRFTHECYFVDNKSEKYNKEFLNLVTSEVKQFNIDFIMQPMTNVVFKKYPKNSIYAPFGTYKIDLNQDKEILWKNLHSKHRNVIRNAEKKGIQIIEDDYDINSIYSLMKNTFARSSMGFMKKEKFVTQLKNLDKNVKVFIAKTSDGQIQGCAILPYSDNSAYYLHGGSVDKPLTGAMNYLHWKAILRFKEIGVETYDFVGARLFTEKGSKLEGIQKFKARFGATLHKGYLWKYPVKPLKYKLFMLLYKLLKKSEGDIIDQELMRLK